MKRSILYILVIIALLLAIFAPVSMGGGQWKTYNPLKGDCEGNPFDCYHYTPGGGNDLEPRHDTPL